MARLRPATPRWQSGVAAGLAIGAAESAIALLFVRGDGGPIGAFIAGRLLTTVALHGALGVWLASARSLRSAALLWVAATCAHVTWNVAAGGLDTPGQHARPLALLALAAANALVAWRLRDRAGGPT